MPVWTTWPRFEDGHPVGEGVGVDGIVRDEQADPVERLEVPAEISTDVTAGAGVECGEWFVEQEQPRLGGQRTGQGDTLGLTARQRAGPVLGVVGQTDASQPGSGSIAGDRFGDLASAQPEGDVLDGGQIGEQQVVLKDDGNRPLLGSHEDVRVGIVEWFTVELDTARIDGEQAG